MNSELKKQKQPERKEQIFAKPIIPKSGITQEIECYENENHEGGLDCIEYAKQGAILQLRKDDW